MKQHKRKSFFGWALLIYCVVICAAIGFGLSVLWNALEAYEASRPEKSIEEYMQTHDRSYWLGALESIVAVEFGPFTHPDATLEDFGIDTAGEISWHRGIGTDTEEIYEIRIGRTKICTLTATQTKDVGYGMRAWEITGEKFAFGVDTQIAVALPEGAVATINGIPVGDEYRVGTGVLQTTLEHSFDQQPNSQRYVIGGLRGPIELKAKDANGEELEPVQISDTEVHFYPEPVYDFGFYAPAAATVTVNGTEITGTLCSDASPKLAPGALLWYEADGLFTEPDIAVTMDGVEAEPLELEIGTCLIPGASAEIEGEMKTFLLGFIHAYVDFTANKNGAADSNFRALAPYLISGSDFYASMYETRENIVWARTSGLKYHSTECYDLMPLGEDQWACRISYSAGYVFNGQQREVESDSVLLITLVDGSYKVSQMEPDL